MLTRKSFVQAFCLLSIAFLAGLVGCSKPNKPKNKHSHPAASSTSETETSSTSEPVKMRVNDLGAQWAADKEGTEKMYGDRVLEVSGTISSFSVDLNGRRFIDLPCGSKNKEIPSIAVFTRDREPWARVGPGQQVTMRGKLHFGGTGPYLSEADIVNPGPNTSITLTAQDLAAEASKDGKAIDAKYKGKGLIVVGKVVRRDEKKATVFLDGGDNKLIECVTVSVAGLALGVPLDEGKEVHIYGVVANQTSRGEGAALKLSDCLPILGQK
jgi:hypothetical protein